MKPLLIVVTLMVLLLVGLSATAAPAPLQTLNPGWNRLEPGGATMCSDGSPYAFFVHPGAADKLLIFFQGGGACWNDAMCGLPGRTYNPNIPADAQEPVYENRGLIDFENPENPFLDYTALVIPYCTGDVHTGHETVEYQTSRGPLSIQHKGYVNASAALEWLYTNYPIAAQVVLTGCSAGGYGAIMHAPAVLDQYPDVPVRHLSDASVGVFPVEEFVGFQTWGLLDNLVQLPAVQAMGTAFNLTDYYIALGAAYPERDFAQYTTTLDETQSVFYGLMAITDWSAGIGVMLQTQGKVDDIAPEWGAGMFASLEKVNAANPDHFDYFIAEGTDHCVIPHDTFYTLSVDGVRFLDWFNGVIAGEPVEDVICEGCEAEN